MIDNQKPPPKLVNQYGVALNHPHRRCHGCGQHKSMVAPIGKRTTTRAGKWYCADCAPAVIASRETT